jgi:integrase
MGEGGAWPNVPYSVDVVSLFFTTLEHLQEGTLKNYSAAISFYHECNNLRSPIRAPLISRLRNGLRRGQQRNGLRTKRALNSDEASLLIEWSFRKSRRFDDHHARLGTLLTLAEANGNRVSENLALKWQDLDWRSQGPRFRPVFLRDSKTDRFSRGTTRTPLDTTDAGSPGQRAMIALQKYHGCQRTSLMESSYIFRAEGSRGDRPIDYDTVRRDLLGACRNVGIPTKDIGWTSMRKTAALATEDRTEGDYAAVQRFLGHKKGSRVTRVYLLGSTWRRANSKSGPPKQPAYRGKRFPAGGE